MRDDIATGEAQEWTQYARLLFVSVAGCLILSALLIAIGNPFGNLPFSIFSQHVITDTHQRFQFPAIVRSKRYDSLVIGTSTSKLLRPAALEAKFGGRFANLAMDSSMAWEQYQIANLFSATVPSPGTLVAALDHVWCQADAGKNRITYRGFPEWMYDTDPWNDLPAMFNRRAVEISARRIAVALGLAQERIAFNGYDVFVPPDAMYDAARARDAIYHGRKTGVAPLIPAAPAAVMRAKWTYPALTWLDEILSRKWRRAIILFTPVHASALPAGNSHWREAECKARISAIARRHNVPVVDFRIVSGITSRDENYWDHLHYRVGIAERIVEGLATALQTKTNDPAGDWVVLNAAH